MSANGRSKSGGAKRAAARSERNGKPKTFAWEGLELSTPAKLPPTLVLDIGRIEALENRGEAAFGPAYELLESLVGADGIAKIREALTSGKLKADKISDGLIISIITAAIDAHGTSVGESSASTTS